MFKYFYDRTFLYGKTQETENLNNPDKFIIVSIWNILSWLVLNFTCHVWLNIFCIFSTGHISCYSLTLRLCYSQSFQFDSKMRWLASSNIWTLEFTNCRGRTLSKETIFDQLKHNLNSIVMCTTRIDNHTHKREFTIDK